MYTAQRLEIRNKELFSGRSAESISEERENFSIKLRKSHRQVYQMKQRLKDMKTKPTREMTSSEINLLKSKINSSIQEILSNPTNESIVLKHLKELSSLFNKKTLFNYFWESDTFNILKSLWSLSFSTETHLALTEMLIGLSVGAPEKCMKMVENGLLDKCFEYIDSSDFSIKENAIWVLNNLSISSKEISSAMLTDLYFMKLLNLSKSPEFSQKTKIVELYANLCFAAKVDFDKTRLLIQVFSDSLSSQTQVLYCVIGFFRLSNKNPENLKEICRMNPQIIQNMTDLNGSEDDSLLLNIVKLLSCFTFQSEMIEKLLDHGILPFLVKMIQSGKTLVKKEAFFLFSNMLIDTESSLMVIVAHKPLITHLFEGIHDFAFEVRLEVWHCIMFLTKSFPFMDNGFYDNLVFNMNLAFKKETDPRILTLLLESYANLIENSQSLQNVVKELLLNSQCFDSMCFKRQHGNKDVADLVESIIDRFYDRNELYGIPDDQDEYQFN